MTDSPSLPFGSRIVLGAFLAQAISIGLAMTAYPVFIESIEHDLGATRTQAAMAIPLVLVGGALFAPLIGRAVDRGLTRSILGGGALLMSLGFAALSWAPTLWTAALLWVSLIGVGHMMIGPLPASTLLANWFIAKRGQVIAIAAMGTTFGGALAPPAANLLIESVGWREALVWFAVATVVLGVPTVLLCHASTPEAVGLEPDGESAAADGETSLFDDEGDGEEPTSILRDPRFWLVAIGFGTMAGISIGYVVHVVEWAQERGLTREEAVGVLTLNAICAAGGKLLFGWLSDRLGARQALFVAVGIELVAWAGLLFAPTTPLFLLSAAFFAVALGSAIPCQASLVAELWGRTRFGQVTGLMFLFSLAGPLLCPTLLGWGFDRLGSYATPMLVFWAVIALPGLSFLFVRPRARITVGATG